MSILLYTFKATSAGWAEGLGHIYKGGGNLCIYSNISWLHTYLCPYCCIHSKLLAVGVLRDWVENLNSLLCESPSVPCTRNVIVCN